MPDHDMPEGERVIPCRVFRCSRQAEMYIYLREDLHTDDLPEALRRRTGHLTEVMQLQLSARRPLARVNVTDVLMQLERSGFFLQMPPAGLNSAPMYFGD